MDHVCPLAGVRGYHHVCGIMLQHCFAGNCDSRWPRGWYCSPSVGGMRAGMLFCTDWDEPSLHVVGQACMNLD